MKTLVFVAVLPDVLFAELLAAAEQSDLCPAKFAAEAIEAALAARRLPKVPPAAYGGRHGRRAETAECPMPQESRVLMEFRGALPSPASELILSDERDLVDV